MKLHVYVHTCIMNCSMMGNVISSFNQLQYDE